MRSTDPVSELSSSTVESYLARIRYQSPIAHDLASLAGLQRAHMATVPFENLDVFADVPVSTSVEWSVPKIVERNRGGWCFEVNGAFAALLDALGFSVKMLGAAVLFDGPTKVVDHVTLEVMLDEPYLVDVGFGVSFIKPLRLAERAPQDGGSGTFELIDSPEGVTLTRHDEEGVPVPQYRFSRVARQLSDFTPASDLLQSDPDLHWSQKRFATRLLLDGDDRITLLEDRLKVQRDGDVEETPVAPDDWNDLLVAHFDMNPAG